MKCCPEAKSNVPTIESLGLGNEDRVETLPRAVWVASPSVVLLTRWLDVLGG